MAGSHSNLEGRMRDFLRDLYPNFELTHVIELRGATQFVLVDEGDFDGLTEFCDAISSEFGGTVELKRQSTQSFQLEVTVPTGGRVNTVSPKSIWTWLPFLFALLLILGTSLYMIYVPSSELTPRAS